MLGAHTGLETDGTSVSGMGSLVGKCRSRIFLESCVFLLLACSRKQASLWLEGDYFQQKLRGQENGAHRAAAAFSRLLSGVDDISINGVENQDKQEPEPVIQPPPAHCCRCFMCC